MGERRASGHASLGRAWLVARGVAGVGAGGAGVWRAGCLAALPSARASVVRYEQARHALYHPVCLPERLAHYGHGAADAGRADAGAGGCGG